MRQDSYRRLHEACLAMANQCSEPEVQARWLAMAEAWLKRATEFDERLHGDKRACGLPEQWPPQTRPRAYEGLNPSNRSAPRLLRLISEVV
jgi:hypothetical protein